MANRLEKAWRALKGAGAGLFRPDRSGLFQFGESNLVDPPSPLATADRCASPSASADKSAPGKNGKSGPGPTPGTIIKAQVAERWINQVTRGLTPEAVDDYLTSAISGDTLNQFALFEEMEEKWPELRTALYKHKLKAARRNPRIVPPDHPQNPARAREKADFANYVFAAMGHWHRTAFNLLDAVGKGISAAEIDWQMGDVAGPDGRARREAVVIAEMPWVNHRHLSWWWDKPELQLFPDLRNRGLHIDVPDRKFVIFHHLSKSGHPARAAMLRPLAWYFLIYLYAMKDWSTLAETFGVDVAHAFCNKDATQEQRNTILLHLSRLAARSGVFDEGTVINLQRAAGGNAFPQEAIVNYCSEKALEALLGSTLATQAGTHGARSLGLVQQDETEELVDWTCLLFAGTMTGTALRWLMDFNFGDATDNPVMELPSASRRDITALANVVNILTNIGVRVPEAWAHAQFDIPQPKAVAETDEMFDDARLERILTPSAVVGRVPSRGENVSSLTTLQAQRALDAIRLRALAEGHDLRAFDQLAAPIEALITHRKAPSDALRELKTVADALSPHQLEGIAPQLLILGDLLARHMSTPPHSGGHHV
jgi:phage gp29-like protein